MTVWAAIADALRDHGACMLISVLSAEGSSPREAGARIVLRPGKRFSGTIGGGQLEFEAIDIGETLLRQGAAGISLRSFALGPDLGQCCGGRVRLSFEAMGVSRLAEAEMFAELEAKGRFSVASKVGEDGNVGKRRVIDNADAPAISLSGGELVESFGEDRTPLYLFGAGHVGRALVLSLAPLPFDLTWIDSRADAFPKYVPANCRLVRSAEPAAELGAAPDGAMVLIMTHSHALDQQIADTALRAGRFTYVGVIGSKTKRARMMSRFRAAGLGEEALRTFACPIGLGTIRSKLPAAIAVSIAADLLARQEAVSEGTGTVRPLATTNRARQ
ncbi:xanthine dehydrogenase accessory protein XdhC [Stappia sp. F7233]|uniref:Xanthine dehydrogenase accessory protein XdhC n=1 Tax=Stappia albiluteola TaxID=2758565 RepID=A0A839ACM5_9HYPH|nr:xanthine dehydrogenase accessory protein XdhC [Stappia albiluteola]MBA5776778.1 xanthine dehydrogenase accessory protein XdhC [Stappia albiluteola]